MAASGSAAVELRIEPPVQNTKHPSPGSSPPHPSNATPRAALGGVQISPRSMAGLSPRAASPSANSGAVYSPRSMSAVPGHIRALAKAIYDDNHSPSLRKPNGELDQEAAHSFLEEMGDPMTEEKWMQLTFAYNDYGQRLRGVDLDGVKRRNLIGVLKATSSIHSDAAYGGISVALELPAVLVVHRVFAAVAQQADLAAAASDVFDVYTSRILALLKKVLTVVLLRADNRRGDMPPAWTQKLVIANIELYQQIHVIVAFLDAVQMGGVGAERFSIRTLISDSMGVAAWEAAAGPHGYFMTAAEAEAMLVGTVPSEESAMVPVLVRLLDPRATGYVTAHSFARVLNVWGSFARIHHAARRDLRTKAFSTSESPPETAARLGSEPPGTWAVTFGADVTAPDLPLLIVDDDGVVNIGALPAQKLERRLGDGALRRGC